MITNRHNNCILQPESMHRPEKCASPETILGRCPKPRRYGLLSHKPTQRPSLAPAGALGLFRMEYRGA